MQQSGNKPLLAKSLTFLYPQMRGKASLTLRSFFRSTSLKENKNASVRSVPLILSVLLIFVMVFSACTGAVEISVSEFYAILCHKLGIPNSAAFEPQQEAVLFTLRFPRILAGALVGAALAVSGAAMQGLFRNPLAEPGLVGISSGASLFAVLVIVLGSRLFPAFLAYFGYYALSVAAFAGASVTTIVVYRISVFRGRAVITTLLLAGIAINALSGAFTGLFTYLATDEELRNITFWSLGSLGGATWDTVQVLMPFTLIPLFALPFLAGSLNALSLGEAQAAHMGVNTALTKKLVIVFSTMAVGAAVAMFGIIGFIGLIIPHIIRMIAGARYQVVIPCSALLGAVVLTLADLLARTIVVPAELPIGILTAITGVPVFIYIIFKEKREKQL